MQRSSAEPSRHAHARGRRKNGDSEARQRKVRKGTHSCWECKRRKMKCILDSPTDTICVGCRRRATKCIGQEFPEEVSAHVDKTRQIGDRVVRVEALVEELIKKVGKSDLAIPGLTPERSGENLSPSDGLPTPTSTDSGCPNSVLNKSSRESGIIETHVAKEQPIREPEHGTEVPRFSAKCRALSRALYDALPTQEDIELICEYGSSIAMLTLETLIMPYSAVGQDGPGSLLRSVKSCQLNSHPVLIARCLLYLATTLQAVDCKFRGEPTLLSKAPREMMKQLANTASSLVTRNDELLGSLEGLECIMLESLYQANWGNLRRGWISMRRAMTIAQLMGIDNRICKATFEVLDPSSRAQPDFMWFRIVFFDRQLCLMLGFSQGSLDCSMASDQLLANETPQGYLERKYCVISSKILERKAFGITCTDLTMTLDLDAELERAARSLPNKWWLIPILSGETSDPQAYFWKARRLVTQMVHYNLLIQLHLPFMLCNSSEGKFDYSRMTCVSASREVLSRFIVLRGINTVAFSCRAADFYALMAGLTLMLAYLNRNRTKQPDHLLGHHCPGDRAMVERALECMEQVAQVNGDPIGIQSSSLLHRLLDIEAETSDGNNGQVERVSVYLPGTPTAHQEDDRNDAVRLSIPYIGVIKIAREGKVSREKAWSRLSNGFNQPLDGGNSGAANSGTLQTDGVASDLSQSGLNGSSTVAGITSSGLGHVDLQQSSVSVPQGVFNADTVTQNQLNDPPTLVGDENGLDGQFHVPDDLFQQHEPPGLAAGVDDWAFQGVDAAFFDSLMNGLADDGNDDIGLGTQNAHMC